MNNGISGGTVPLCVLSMVYSSMRFLKWTGQGIKDGIVLKEESRVAAGFQFTL